MCTFYLLRPYKLPLRRCADLPCNLGPTAHNTLMHSRLNAVVHLQIQLRELVFLIGRGLFNVSERRRIDNVTYDEALDGLILRDGLTGRGTSDTLDVSASMLIPSVVASFNRHGCLIIQLQLEVREGRNKKKSDYTIIEKSIILIFASCMDKRRAAFDSCRGSFINHLTPPSTVPAGVSPNATIASRSSLTTPSTTTPPHPHRHFIDRWHCRRNLVPTSTSIDDFSPHECEILVSGN